MDQPERKRRGPLTWLAGRSRRFRVVVAVAVNLPVLYVAGFGVACWHAYRNSLPEWAGPLVKIVYWPLHSGVAYGPEPLLRLVRWYASLFAP